MHARVLERKKAEKVTELESYSSVSFFVFLSSSSISGDFNDCCDIHFTLLTIDGLNLFLCVTKSD